jgi:hypothetical protein
VIVAALAVMLLSPEKPTRTGDIIGYAEMHKDQSIDLHLRSVQCDGMIAEGIITVKPTDATYGDILKHLGGMNPDGTKPIPAWPTPPCPAK